LILCDFGDLVALFCVDTTDVPEPRLLGLGQVWFSFG